MESSWTDLLDKTGMSTNELLGASERLFFADLHAESFKSMFLSHENGIFPALEYFDRTYSLDWNSLDSSLINVDGFRELFSRLINTDANSSFINGVPNALFYCTRPFTTLEMTILLPEWSSVEGIMKMNEYLSLLNVSNLKTDIKYLSFFKNEGDGDHSLVKIAFEGEPEEIDRTFALTSFETQLDSWTAYVRGDGVEPDAKRYVRLNQLLNDLLRCTKRVHYVVFPELSIPRRLLINISLKLKSKGISLIAGVEYEMRSATPGMPARVKGLVSNQLVYILNTKIDGFTQQVCIVQEKTDPAIHEERDLFDVGGHVLVPRSYDKYLINHGGLLFSGLICNDLLNIDYRQALRGMIDALIVIEWNKDIDTYDPIVQSASNDLHCFVVQVNNRAYGDTRLRAPYKDAYRRDVVKVKGGELDYFVVSTLETEKLREFQRYHVSPDRPFKPVPTGYEMSSERRKIKLL